ncbi:hypothetical protein A33M_3828 [Rhodovulum sp. PH10]|nr:hypothetical protein A33M_3828 [Rhodovulum sp. PH10]
MLYESLPRIRSSTGRENHHNSDVFGASPAAAGDFSAAAAKSIKILIELPNPVSSDLNR